MTQPNKPDQRRIDFLQYETYTKESEVFLLSATIRYRKFVQVRVDEDDEGMGFGFNSHRTEEQSHYDKASFICEDTVIVDLIKDRVRKNFTPDLTEQEEFVPHCLSFEVERVPYYVKV